MPSNDSVPTALNKTNARDGLVSNGLCTRCSEAHGKQNPSDFSQSFIAQPLSEDNEEIPIRVEPKLLLLRAHLPLSYLAPYLPSTSPKTPRFFSSNALALNHLESCLCRKQRGHNVLIVALDDIHGLFAVEKAYDTIYSLSALDQQLTLEDLEQLSIGSKPYSPQVELPQSFHPSGLSEWWHDISLKGIHHSRPAKRRKLDLHGFSGESPRITACESCYDHAAETTDPHGVLSPPVQSERHVERTTLDEIPDLQLQPADDELFFTVVKQYLDALYLSKTSLAYFAKGPLSRARANLGLSKAHALKLSTHLRSMVLGPVIDKKYKETLPMILNDTVSKLRSNLDGSSNLVKSTRKKKSKQAKVKKNGTYAEEEDFVIKWWSEVEQETRIGTDITEESLMKNRLAELRFRESLLQIVLSLEILSIEATLTDQEDPSQEEQIGETQNTEPDVNTWKSAAKKKVKPKDIRTGVDVLLDWLCIWHSIHSSEKSARKQTAENGQDQIFESSNSGNVDSSDSLKNFCVEVIIPFYSSRLPDVIKSLCDKLGAPSAPSPVRRKLSSNNSSKRRVMPGAEVYRDGHSKPKYSAQQPSQGLSKIATVNNRSFSRTSTDTMVPQVKRERSSTPQASLSSISNGRTLSRSNSISQVKKFSQREVDMSSMVNPKSSRLREKVDVSEELKDAIATLKRPNRGQAVKEYFASAEKSATVTGALPKRSTTSRKRGINPPVQVTATPKRVDKTRQEVVATPQRLPQEQNAYGVSSSSTAYVPASSIRTGHWLSLDKSQTDSEKFSFKTPSRTDRGYDDLDSSARDSKGVIPNSTGRQPRNNLRKDQDNIVNNVKSSPSKESRNWHNNANKCSLLTPPKNTKESAPSPSSNNGIMATPLASTHLSNIVPLKGSRYDTNETPSKSIYKTLGWDDDDVDELM